MEMENQEREIKNLQAGTLSSVPETEKVEVILLPSDELLECLEAANNNLAIVEWAHAFGKSAERTLNDRAMHGDYGRGSRERTSLNCVKQIARYWDLEERRGASYHDNPRHFLELERLLEPQQVSHTVVVLNGCNSLGNELGVRVCKLDVTLVLLKDEEDLVVVHDAEICAGVPPLSAREKRDIFVATEISADFSPCIAHLP